MISRYTTLLILSIIFAVACNEDSNNSKSQFVKDPHSYSNPAEARTTHLTLDLDLDFDTQTISGIATYKIEASDDAEEIILDVRNMTIKSVTVDGVEAEFTVGEDDEILGSALTVAIKPQSKEVAIGYNTSPDAAALQWLNPQQTADKNQPFLFTQGQAILTRTWVPCQDSPGIRITYDARVTCPQGMLTVMSADNPTEKSADGVYQFKMDNPIPPYLLALACGDLVFEQVGAQTGVYAEPSVITAAANEFSDMQAMLEVAEELYGDYLWGRYDVIVLPPSFPFGGMENPKLTFATPTILAGDKSLTALIAHELAHSWSGNLVTNATWNDFWLNEGFTVYFERRIMEALYGEEYANMLALLGYQDLKHTVDDLGNHSADTHLHLDLAGRDPDDGMTDIAYEKGAHMLVLLEQEVGRETFDTFLKEYFETHKFKSMTTEAFIDYINEKLIKPHGIKADIKEWIYGPGIPQNVPIAKSGKFEYVDKVVEMATKRNIPADTVVAGWTTHEWLHFIRHLPDNIEPRTLQFLDKKYDFAHSGNSEIAAAWYQKAIHSGYYKEILPEIETFLIKVGRRKFLTPLYRALVNADDKETAIAIYNKAKSNYHSVSTQTMDALLGLD